MVPVREHCSHGVPLDRDCRLCELIIERELKRIQPKHTSAVPLFWTIIIAALILAQLIWERK